MRTAPVALAYLHDPDALVAAAQEISAMTHHDPEAGEACALWCLAIRHAVLHGTLDVRSGLAHLPAERARVWAIRLDEAEAGQPADFEKNGWVVHALQGAWSAITTTAAADHHSSPSTAGPEHFRLALEAAVRGGRDTDTVAAIAGSLVGGLYGASAVPAQWRRKLHGWPGLRARDLVRLGVLTARGGKSDASGWPAAAQMDYSKFKESGALAQHPVDDHLWIGGVDAVAKLPPGVNAIVSLCRMGDAQVPAKGVAVGDHIEVWLIDESEPDKNPNLDFVLTDVVAAVAALRAEGKTVLLHCVQAQSRTPAVAALYGARLNGRAPIDVLGDIKTVLPNANPNHGLREALKRLG
jgi:ADP-ribosyl-[dinitrogen reductase] hydrolase